MVAALDSGHTLKQICERLNAGGVAVDYKTLSAYVSILCRKQPECIVTLMGSARGVQPGRPHSTMARWL
jgi:hypothetical protein